MAFNASGKTDKKDAANKTPVVDRAATERITVALIPKAGEEISSGCKTGPVCPRRIS